MDGDGDNRGAARKPPRDDRSSPSQTHNGQQQQHSQGHSRLQRRLLEQQMIQDFDRVLVKQMSTIRAPDMGEAEKEFAFKFFRSVGVVEGVTAAVLAFYGLNRFPRHFARYMTRKQQQQQQSYVLDKTSSPTKPAASPFQPPDKKELGKQVSRKRNKFLFTALELAFDLGMSFGVGICVSLLTTDKVEAMKTATDVPLQPGRSLLSDQCCPSLVEEYKRQWRIRPKDESTSGVTPDTATDNTNIISRKLILQRPEHETLHFILTLTQNCQHRHVMEHQLREDQMLPDSAPVPIPDTGVVPQTEDPLLAMMLQEGEVVDGGSYDPQSWSHEQVKDWVNDQGDK